MNRRIQLFYAVFCCFQEECADRGLKPNSKNMMTKNFSKVALIALILSLLATGLAGFSIIKAQKATLSEGEFLAKVEKGIEGYIDKQREAQNGAEQTGPIDVSIDDDAIKGDKNAPVTIVEFSDFECPFCERFYTNTLPDLISEYIEKGKVRFVYRDFPLSFHRNARAASLAAECAKEQGGDDVYFRFHNKLYENQAGFDPENFKKWASEMGLKGTQFNECLDSEKYASEVDKDFQDGQQYGVTGTPAFFINGRRISGAQPFSVFKSIIDEELNK